MHVALGSAIEHLAVLCTSYDCVRNRNLQTSTQNPSAWHPFIQEHCELMRQGQLLY